MKQKYKIAILLYLTFFVLSHANVLRPYSIENSTDNSFLLTPYNPVENEISNGNSYLKNISEASTGIDWIDDLYGAYFEVNEISTKQKNTVVINELETLPIANCVGDFTISLQADGTATISVVDIDNGTSTGVLSIDISSFDCSNIGTPIVVTLTSDLGGSCTTTITVEDTTAPSFVVSPANITVECTASTAPGDTNGPATANDNCDGSPTIDYTDVVSGVSGNNSTITRTWTATDDNSNVSSHIQTITVEDTTAPSFVVSPANITVECTASTAPGDTNGPATANDNCDGSPTIDYTDVVSGVSGNNSTITRTWTATDDNSNVSSHIQTITVEDTTAPTITCPPNITANTSDDGTGNCSATVFLGSPAVSDNCAATGSLLVSNDAPATFPMGTTTVTWVVEDPSGNSSSCTQDVTVADNEKPTASNPADITIQCLLDVPVADPLVVTDEADNCGTVTVTFKSQTFDPAVNDGTITRTYTVDDGNGNTIDVFQNIVINDTTAPVLDVLTLPDVTGECTATIVSVPTATDNCGGSIIGTTSDSLTRSTQGTSVITWEYDDGNGQVVTQTQRIVITDTTNPTANSPSPVIVECSSDIPSININVVTGKNDNCSTSANIIVAHESDVSDGNSNPELITRTYSVTDEVGNSINVIQIITVDDISNPTLTPIGDRNENLNSGCNFSIPDYTGLTTANDNCTSLSSITKTQSPAVGTIISGHNTTQLITITADDGNGNSSNTSFTITLKDITPPILSPGPNQSVDLNLTCSIVIPDVTGSVTDNCAVTITQNPLAGTLVGLSHGATTTITVTATDTAGLTDAETVVITANDVTDPVLTVGADRDVNLDANCQITIPDVRGTATDNCTVTITQSPAIGAQVATSHNGTTIVTVTATDAKGNTDVDTVILTAKDITAPTITCPSDILVDNDNGNCSAIVSWAMPIVDDNCTYTINSTHNSGDVFPVGTTTVTYSITDAASNSVQCSFDVTVVDNELPVITLNGSSSIITIESCSDPYVEEGAMTNDNCSVGSVIIGGHTVDVDTPGTYIVTYNVTDIHGNVATEVTRTIKVVDSRRPTVIAKPITLQLDINGNASIAAPEINDGSSDDCGIASMTVSPNTFDCSNVGKNEVILTVTDINGLTDTKKTMVTVEDNIAPNAVTQNITIQLDTSGNASITAADINNGSNDACGIASVTVSPSSFDCAELGSNTVTLTVTDNNSNVSTASATVIVEDDILPTITCPTDIVINNDSGNCSAVVNWIDPVANDNCTFTVSSTHNSGDTFLLGTTTVTYTVIDSSGNTAQCSFDVTVQDNEAPVVALIGSASIMLEACTDTYSERGAIATDNCSVGSVIVGGDVVDVNTLGIYIVTYNVIDANGNSAVQVTRTVTVQDTTAPVPDVTNLPNVTGECSASVIAPTATDNCAGLITATTSDPLTYNSQGTFTITWTFNDGNGNTTTQTQTVIVDDITNPIITAPSNILISADAGQCSASGVNLGLPIVSDNCSGYVVTNDASEPYNLGDTIITWTITDTGGNTATATQTITVTDDEDPILNCISDQNVSFDVDCLYELPDYTSMASATDNCTSVVITQSPVIGTAIFGTTTITLTATDNSGNTSTCTFDVIPIDNTPPVANAKDITIELSAFGVVNLNADDLDNGSSDACGVVLTTASPNSFNCSDVGPNTVTFTVYDDEGNRDTTTAIVTVEDVTPPTMLCRDAVIVIDPITREAVLTTGDVDNGVNDICGIQSLSVSPATFPENPDNSGTVYYTTAVLSAEDINGNINTCTVNVTVEPPKNENTYLTGEIINPIPENPQLPSSLIDATACPGSLYDPKDVQLTLQAVGSYNLQASDVVEWEYSDDNGETWNSINGTSGLLTYTLLDITNDTFVRLVIKDSDDPTIIRTSAEAFIRFLPPDEPPTIVDFTSTEICLGASVTVEAESYFDQQEGQFGEGGKFNYAQPDGWRVDGKDGEFPASGNNKSEPTWKETNSNDNANSLFSGINYDTEDNTKFAIAHAAKAKKGAVQIFETTLETPVFSTIGMTRSEAIMSFYHGYYFCGGGFGKIELSFDSGNTYTQTLNTVQGDDLTSGNTSGVHAHKGSSCSKQFPVADDFKYASLDLGQWVGYSGLRVKFTFSTGPTGGWCDDVTFPKHTDNNCGGGDEEFDVGSAWAIDDVGFAYSQVDDELEWTDEDNTVIAIGTTATITPITPGQRRYGVTNLVNGCRSDNSDGTEFIDINTSLAYAGKDFTPLASNCGESAIQLNAYDNSLTALDNFNKGAYEANLYYVPVTASENYTGTGVGGTWSIVTSLISSPCGAPGTFSDNADPDAVFTGNPGTYTLRWTLANGCSDDVEIKISDCSTIDFDGVNDFVTFKNNYNIDDDFSIEVWVKPESVSGTSTIFSRKDFADNSGGYDLSIVNGQVQFNWFGTGAGSVTTGSRSIDNSRWYHIAVTFNGSVYKLYIDGLEIGSVSSSNAPSQSANNIEALVGAMDQGPSNDPTNYLNGWVDELRIWNVGLTEGQVRQMMNQEIEDAGGDVHGVIIPRKIYGIDSNNDGTEESAIIWDNLDGYYRMNLACGDLEPHDKGVAGRLRNITTSQQETAPLPYYSRIDNQTWDTDSAWVNYTVNDPPNSTGINGDYIDWNIVQLDHSIKTGSRDVVLLGLIQNSGEFTVEDPTASGIPGQSLGITKYLKLDGVIDLIEYSQLVQKRFGHEEYIDLAGTNTPIIEYVTDQFEDSELDENSSGYIEKDGQGRRSAYIYNYWSSPVSAQGAPNNSDYSISQVLLDGNIASDPLPNINYVSSAFGADGTLTSPITLSTYWMWKFNGTNGDYWSWQWLGHNGSLKVGEGYTMKGPDGTTNDPSLTYNYVFKGKPHNGSFTRSIVAGNSRLVGNPYPSAMSADEFIKDNISVAAGGRRDRNVINGTLYFWHHFQIVNHNLREYIGGYATYNLTGGVEALSTDYRINATGDVGGQIPRLFIAIGQSFFVNTANDDASSFEGVGGDIQFKNTQRFFWRKGSFSTLSANYGSVFFKAPSKKVAPKSMVPTLVEDVRSKIRLHFHSPKGYLRKLLLGTDNNATMGYDLAYDALIADEIREDMYWLLDEDKYVIQGIPELNWNQEFPIGVVVQKEGEIEIKLDTIQNNFDHLEVFVKDKVLNETFNISEEPFVLELEEGEYNDRFSIVFEPFLKPVDEVGVENGILVYMDNDQDFLKVEKLVETEIRKIVMYNAIGQVEYTWESGLERHKLEFPVNLATGVYFIQVDTSDGIKNSKVLVE